MYRVCFIILSFSLPVLAHGGDHAAALDERYAPYADWAHYLAPGAFQGVAVDRWWRSPETIRQSRKDGALPFSGFHLALDPGHIGGAWAPIEGRDFKINQDDLPIREGELVLEVARRVRAELVEMGAKVTLLREGCAPLNPKPPEAYFSKAAEAVALPEDISRASLVDYGLALRQSMNRRHAVVGELAERARRVNEDIRPDALVSLHINAAPWPRDETGKATHALVGSNHTHVLIFGCLSEAELSVPLQKKQMVLKMINGSAPIERELGQAFGRALAEATALPPSQYNGRNAIRLAGHTPYLWARNLMLLRYVRCPVVLLEPYIANSEASYPRLQDALRNRRTGKPLAEDDLLVEYAGAVVEGLLAVYGPGPGE